MDDMELDLFEKDGMESDFVLDTPDRLARMPQKSKVNRDHNSSFFLGSPGRTRHIWRGNSRSSNEIVPFNKESNGCVVRRMRLASPISDSVETSNPHPHVPRSKSENSDRSPGHASTSGQRIVSDSSKHSDGNAIGPAVPSGTSCPKMHSSDKNKLEKNTHGKNRYDPVTEVTEVLDSPEPRTIRKSVKDAMSELPENKSVVEGTDAGIKHLSLGPDLKHQRQQSLFSPGKLENRAKTTTNRALMQNGPSSHTKVVICSTGTAGEASAVGGSGHKNQGEIADRCGNSVAQNDLLNHDATSRKFGHRKLVRNGCISPSNIAKGKTVIDIKSDGKNKIVENSCALPSLGETEQETRQNSERYLNDKMKGKEISYGNEHINGRTSKPESSSRRLLTEGGSREGQRVMSWFVEEPCWKTTGNRKGGVGNSRKISSFPEVPVHIHENLVGDREHENKIDANPGTDSFGKMPSLPLEPTTSSTVQICTNKAANHCRGLDKSPTILKGKRKSRSARNHLDDSSSDHLESLFFSSFGHSSATILPARSRSSQRSGASNASVIDVDGLCSPERCRSTERITSTSDDSHARALQVESDERLARQLQEQLFSEEPVFGGDEEIDASIAWTLQQEEDSQGTNMVQGQHRLQTRGISAAHLYRQYPRNPLNNSSGRIPSHGRASARMPNLHRSLNRRNMDLDSRIDFLEAMEAVFDASIEERVSHRPNPLLHVQRDFNEGDYEMLLSLDNDNDRHCGASLHQINSLPLSKVQSENGEPCAVCLEIPTLGETIRHLPCLHKFHKDCIDTWLRRKTSCPVCKCGIT